VDRGEAMIVHKGISEPSPYRVASSYTNAGGSLLWRNKF
jgi:hypothetical protein